MTRATGATRCGAPCAGDLLTPGDVFVLRNSITTPRNAATSRVRRSRQDRIDARVHHHRRWLLDAARVGARRCGVGVRHVEVRPRLRRAGRAEHTDAAGTSPAFETSSLIVMAAQDGTNVKVDANADGTFETNQTINQGQVVYIDGGVLQGAHVVSDKPVQVHEGTGDVGSNYESRWFTLFPTSLLSSDYLSPVGSGADNQRTIVYLYNPSNADITVTPTCTGCAGTISVPAQGHGRASRHRSTKRCGSRASGNVPFIAVGGVGAQSGAAPGSTGDNSHDLRLGLHPRPDRSADDAGDPRLGARQLRQPAEHPGRQPRRRSGVDDVADGDDDPRRPRRRSRRRERSAPPTAAARAMTRTSSWPRWPRRASTTRPTAT